MPFFRLLSALVRCLHSTKMSLSHRFAQPTSIKSGISSTIALTRLELFAFFISFVTSLRTRGWIILLRVANLSASAKAIPANFLRSILPPRPKMVRPKRATSWFRKSRLSRRLWAILSASITAHPNLANSAATALLPDPTPPKIPIIGFF